MPTVLLPPLSLYDIQFSNMHRENCHRVPRDCSVQKYSFSWRWYLIWLLGQVLPFLKNWQMFREREMRSQKNLTNMIHQWRSGVTETVFEAGVRGRWQAAGARPCIPQGLRPSPPPAARSGTKLLTALTSPWDPVSGRFWGNVSSSM